MKTLAGLLPHRLGIRESGNYKWYALGAVMLGTIMGPLDGSIANVALATIGRAFKTPVDNVEWVLLAYLLVAASTLVLFGRIGDLIGQKRVYLLGFAIFGASSVACALAPSLGGLIAARAVQGVGAAMLMSCTPAIIVQVFPSTERGRAIGLNGAALAVGLTAGPVIGGLIVTYSDWRWIFLINVPISITALVLAALILGREASQRARFDFAGAAVASSALFAVTLALSRVHVWGWSSPATLGLFAYFALATAFFIRLERRVVAPMLDLGLFADRTFALSVIAATVYFCGVFAVIFTVPVAAQVALGRSGLEAGLMVLPISALNVVLAPLAGSLSDKVPARYISTIGSTVFCLGALLLALLPAIPPTWMIVVALLFAGCGTAVFSQPNNSTIMGHAPRKKRGVASGVLATARTSGQVLGIAAASAVYFSVARHGFEHTFIPAKAVFFMVTALLVFVSVISFARD